MNITSYKSYLTSHGNSLGEIKKKQSDKLMDMTFDKDPTYKRGMLYNANLEPIEVVEFKFQKAQTYTINKDQVEYFVQFRTDYHPEKQMNTEDKIYRLYDDGKERLSFYLDVPDDNGDVYKWLIVGRNYDNAFVRYNILQCNWVFEWMVDRKYYHCLGVMRSRNNYNSGVWSDGTTQTVENQTSFFVPTNDKTRTIDYDIRFMITDNPLHPKTYEASKVEDTFPLGLQKITLVQDHYNNNTDICKKLDGDENAPKELRDGKIHMICDYNKSGLPPIVEEVKVDEDVKPVWYLSDVSSKLYLNSTEQKIQALNDNGCAEFDNVWNFELINANKVMKFTFNDDVCYDEVDNFYNNDNKPTWYGVFKVGLDPIMPNTLIIKALHRSLAGYMLKVSIGSEDGDYYDYVEMEVVN